LAQSIANVTRDSDAMFQGQKVKGQLAYCGGLPQIQMSISPGDVVELSQTMVGRL